MKKLIFLLLFPCSCYAVDIHCVAKAVYFEGRGESYAGQAAIAQVILSRAAHKAYPSKPCEVVKQKKKGVWQFSFWKRKDLTIKKEDKYNLALSITKCVVDGYCSVPAVGSSTVYYACSGPNAITFPRTWDRNKLKFQAKLGHHCFFREV